MSYRGNGHNTVGNRTVGTLEELRNISTQGAGDVFQGQMVVVKEIDYSALVGAGSGRRSDLADDAARSSWTGVSEGYVELNAGSREHLRSTFPVSNTSLVDADSTGTSLSIWFNPHKAPRTAAHQTIFHIPSLSVNDSPITNQYAPSLSVNGVSLHLARHPEKGHPCLLTTLSVTAPYSGSQVQGDLYQNVAYWVEDFVSLHEWHHVLITVNSSQKRLEVWLDGQLKKTQPLASDVPDYNNYLKVYLNGEDRVTDHDIFIGASLNTDGDVVNHFSGYVDSFCFLKQYSSSSDVNRLYSDGVITEGSMAQGSFITPVIHWPMGENVTNFQAPDLLIQNAWDDGGYPSIEAVNCSSMLNLRSRDKESQYDIVRMQNVYGDVSSGYNWCKSFAPSQDLKSRKSVKMNPSEGNFAYLSTEMLTGEYWEFLDNLTSGTLSLTFFPDSSQMVEPAAGMASTYSLFSLGYSAANAEDRHGIQAYITKNSFLNDWSVVIVAVEKDTGIEVPLYGQGNLSLDAWNTLVFSWDFGVEDGEVAASLYLNKLTLSTKLKGADVSRSSTGVSVNRDAASRLQIGSILFKEADGNFSQLNPWGGRIDDLIISTSGDPASHELNVNPRSSSAIMQNAVLHYTFGDLEGDVISDATSVYSTENRIQNILNPGIVGKIKNDLFRVFDGPSADSRLVFEDGFSGTLIPVPKPVPSNWGTYYWDAEQAPWDTSYPDQIDYGFIHIKPSDVGSDELGRWVSVVSYTAWTAYLFSETESLSFEPGYRDGISEGDVAMFTESGKVVPGEVIEQWVNPNLFPNNKPAPDSIGLKGQRCYDGYYMYECVATNTWIRYLTEAFW